MPYTILVEHSVGVVHPSILRSVMIKRTMLLNILSVKSIRISHAFPAGKVINCPCRAHISVEGDVKEFTLTNLVRHEIIDIVNSKSAVDCLYQLIIAHHPDVCMFFFLFNRQQEILLTLFQLDHSMSFAKDFFSHLGLCAKRQHKSA